MQRNHAAVVLAAGIAAFAPLGLFVLAFVLMQFMSPGPFGAFARWSLIAMWIIVFAYIVYALFSSAVPGLQKIFWAFVLLVGNILVLPLFWFFYVWRKAHPLSSRGI